MRTGPWNPSTVHSCVFPCHILQIRCWTTGPQFVEINDDQGASISILEFNTCFGTCNKIWLSFDEIINAKQPLLWRLPNLLRKFQLYDWHLRRLLQSYPHFCLGCSSFNLTFREIQPFGQYIARQVLWDDCQVGVADCHHSSEMLRWLRKFTCWCSVAFPINYYSATSAQGMRYFCIGRRSSC